MMMPEVQKPTVKIESSGCRGCSLCVEKCPVKVFDQIEHPKVGGKLAIVSRAADCIGCFACYYLCPSQCISIGNVDLQRPFYRFDENIPLAKRFLGVQTTAQELTEEDWKEAEKDVTMTLVALAKASESVVGRGLKALGRRAGTVAAPHLPDVFEAQGLAKRLERLQGRFQHCFDFNFEIQEEGEEIHFTFAPCSLFQIVENEKEKVGEAGLCQLFHEFLAGLVSAYAGVNYRHVDAATKIDAPTRRCNLVYNK